MAKPISIDILANSQGVKREMTQLERFMEGVAKRLGGTMQRGGAARGVDLLTKQMQALTKATDTQVQKVNTLATALRNVNQQMGGASGGDLKNLQQQQKLLQRQFGQANTRLGALQQLGVAAAQKGPGAPPGGAAGQGGGGFAQAAGGAVSGAGNILGVVLPRLLGPLALLGSVAGIVDLAMKAYEKSAVNKKILADLMPRLVGPGAAGAGVGSHLDKELRRMGTPLGFKTDELLGAAGTLSTGGFRSLGGLKSDTKAAAQMSRLFGLDLGGEASTLAEGGRMGAFRPGDAKKFATMLASEISKTGLGPRAQEVQEATLMLLNSQLRTQATANPGPVMALQTMLNKTGLPAFTGTRGASLLNTLNESVTNPRGEAQEALNQQVFMHMGAKNYFQMEEMKEQGLSNPKYLPNLIKTMRKGTGNRKEFLFGLMQQTGIPLLQLEKLDQKLPGGLSGITPGRMAGVQAMLKSGGIDISSGAAKTMAQTGNKIRFGEAALDDVMLQFGDVLADKLGDVEAWLATHVEKALNIVDKNTGTTADKITALADFFIGAPVDKALGGSLSNADKLKKSLNLTPFGSKVFDWTASHVFGSGRSSDLGAAGMAHQMGLKVISGFRPGSVIRHGKHAGQPGYHSMGSPSDPGAVDITGPDAKVNAYWDWIWANVPHDKIREMIYTPKGLVTHGRYFPGGPFDPSLRKEHRAVSQGGHLHMSLEGMGGTVTIRHEIHEHGVVAESSKHAVKKMIKQTAHEAARDEARAQPNKRNARQ